MELHIKERLLLPTILPEKGTFMDFNIKKSILSKIAITEKDKETFGIVEKPEERRVEWDIQKDAENPLVLDFSKEEIEYIRKSCEQLSDQELPDEIWFMVSRIYDETNSKQ